ncbi:glycosyltransferase [Chitinophaga sp. NPDC101104]|uniref:glycosyltransferase n=1 Tax=Chitinophaga sp. NPDC101104 TaxID=3390561 RepID=UPI003D08C38A
MAILNKPRLRIFTWHVHGSYLFYLSQGDYDIFIPVRPEKGEGYWGRGETFPFGDNVREIPADQVRHQHFDLILFQSESNYRTDQYAILSEAQRQLPRIYLEHNTPAGPAAATPHPANDPGILLVHVTHYNRLMWDNHSTPTMVIPHGVTDTPVPWTGGLARGLTVVNHMKQRGRALGWDLLAEARSRLPIDLAGMGNGASGIGEILHPQLPAARARYRFLFHPIRHTSLALAVCEAMMQGMPVAGLAVTELAAVIQHEQNGIAHTDINVLFDGMERLLRDHAYARRIGLAGRETARELFNIRRFTADWEDAFHLAITAQAATVVSGPMHSDHQINS